MKQVLGFDIKTVRRSGLIATTEIMTTQNICIFLSPPELPSFRSAISGPLGVDHLDLSVVGLSYQRRAFVGQLRSQNVQFDQSLGFDVGVDRTRVRH